MSQSPNVAVKPLSIEEVRTEALKNVKLESIQHMQKEELLKLQRALKLGGVWGKLDFPKEWMAAGVTSQKAFRLVNIAKILGEQYGSSAVLEHATLMLTRFTILCMVSPATVGRIRIYLKPSSVINAAKKASRLARLALLIDESSTDGLFKKIPRNLDTLHRREHNELKRMQLFADHGLWTDIAPLLPPELPPRETPAAQGADNSALKSASRTDKKETPFLPLSDEFVAAAGWRIAWLVEKFTPAMLKCGKGLMDICAATPLNEGNFDTQRWRRTERCKEFLADFDWRTPEGEMIEDIPFIMDFNGMGGKAGKFSWPLRTLSHARRLLRIIQGCNLFIYLLCVGGRISETLSLNNGCIVESTDGIPLANGRTYKLSYMVGGQERDWPLPAIALTAIKQQEQLAAIIGCAALEGTKAPRQTTDSIWIREGVVGGRIDGDYNKYLENLVTILGLEREFGPGNMHAHRFRKTIARLLALAIIGAPKIVMDLFGHRHINQALHYILADPEIQAEILDVATAQTLLLAKNSLLEKGEMGGPAANRIQAIYGADHIRVGQDWNEDDLNSMAETLTLEGRFWMLVRPGVICTKGPQEAGACTPNAARPDTSRCRHDCGHRLEQAFLKDDVDRTIEEAVRSLQRAINYGDDYNAEMWRGQVVANIDRFPSLRQKWQKHSLVATILERKT